MEVWNAVVVVAIVVGEGALSVIRTFGDTVIRNFGGFGVVIRSFGECW